MITAPVECLLPLNLRLQPLEIANTQTSIKTFGPLKSAANCCHGSLGIFLGIRDWYFFC